MKPDCGGAVHTNCGCIHSMREFAMSLTPLTDDPYLLPWQRTVVTPLMVGGPADGETKPVIPRCFLPDRITTAPGVWYRIGVYRDAHTVEYVPA